MAISNDSLRWWYDCNNGSSAETDEHGAASSLTANNSPTTGTGPAGGGDVANDYDAASSESHGSSGINDDLFEVVPGESWTIAGWVNFDSKDPSGDKYVAGSKAVSSLVNWQIRHASAGPGQFGLEIGTSGVEVVQQSLGGFSSATWYPFWITFDHTASTNGDVTVSINGSTTSSSLSNAINDGGGNTNFFIGANYQNTTSSTFDGLISRLAMWSRVLSSSELTDWDNGPIDYADLTTAGTTTTPNPVTVSWSVVAPSLDLSITPSPVSSNWTPVAPSLDLSVTQTPVGATWSVVAPSLDLAVTQTPLSSSWSAVAPSLDLSVTPAPVTASWTVPPVTASTGQIVTPSPVSLSWAVATPSTTITTTPTPPSASWSTASPSVAISLTPAAVVSSWSVIAPDLALTVDVSPTSAAWSVVAATTDVSQTPAALTASWSTVAPQVDLDVTPPPAAATWTAVTATATTGIVATHSPVVATWSVPSPSTSSTITAPAAVAAWSGQTPSANVSVTQTPVGAAWSVPTPTVSVTTRPAPVSAVWSIGAVAKSLTQIAASVAVAWSVLTPTTSVGGVVVEPAPLVARWSVPEPEIAVLGYQGSPALPSIQRRMLDLLAADNELSAWLGSRVYPEHAGTAYPYAVYETQSDIHASTSTLTETRWTARIWSDDKEEARKVAKRLMRYLHRYRDLAGGIHGIFLDGNESGFDGPKDASDRVIYSQDVTFRVQHKDQPDFAGLTSYIAPASTESVEQRFLELLDADNKLTSWLGPRIYPEMAPQAPTYPYAVYDVDMDQDASTTTLTQSLVSMTIASDDAEEAGDIAKRLVKYLHRYRDVRDKAIHGIFVEGAAAGHTGPMDGSNRVIYQHVVDLVVHHKDIAG